MEKLLEAILLATMPDQVKEAANESVTLVFNKEKGLKGEVTTTIAGPVSGVYAGLCTLLPDALRAMAPNDREKQKRNLDSIYRNVSAELGIR